MGKLGAHLRPLRHLHMLGGRGNSSLINRHQGRDRAALRTQHPYAKELGSEMADQARRSV